MARCGCQGAGSTTCEAIVNCVASVLGPGLSFTNGNIQTRISRDGGNCIRYGSDQGLYAPCDNGGDPGGGRRTVEGLPDNPIAGSLGGAGLIHAFASPAAIEYAVANRVDIIDSYSWRLADGVAAWSPYPPTTQISFYTNSPAPMPGNSVTSSAWTQLESDPGVPGGNPTGRNSGAPEQYLEPDGGWYGWRQRPHELMTTSDALHRIAARAVVMLTSAHPSSIDIPAHIDAILSLQAQDWVIPTVPLSGLAAVEQYLEVLIPHVGVSILPGESWGSVTPAQIADSGATWVKIRETEDPEFIAGLVDAGLNVLSGWDARHTTGQELLDSGVRGLISNDPVYQRGALGEEWQYYRVAAMAYPTKTTETGTLTSRTHIDVHPARGFAIDALGGRWYPREFGWENGVARFNPSQLLGFLCPLPDPDVYTLRISVRIQGDLPTGDYPGQGVIIGSDNDLDPSWPVTDDPPTTRHGYLAYIRRGDASQGQLVIGVFDLNGEYTQLAVSDDTQPAPANQWIDLEIAVDSETVTLTRTDGTPYSVSVDDTTWRGPYCYYTWTDTSSPTVSSPFFHGHSSIGYFPEGDTGNTWAQLAFNFEDWDAMAAAYPTWADAAEGDFGTGNIDDE